jgi:hypothetical protein
MWCWWSRLEEVVSCCPVVKLVVLNPEGIVLPTSWEGPLVSFELDHRRFGDTTKTHLLVLGPYITCVCVYGMFASPRDL